MTTSGAGASAQLARLLSLIPWLQARPGVTKTEAAAAFGISTAQLEREGVRSFWDSYHQLLGCIERKLAAGAR